MPAGFVWLLLAIGIVCAVALLVVTVSGAFVERIVWFDAALIGSLAGTACSGVLLFALGSRLSVSAAFALSMGWAAFLMFIFTPVAMLVARTRRQKGWNRTINGKQPVVR